MGAPRPFAGAERRHSPDRARHPGTRGSYGVGTICAMPGRLVAPGPGRSARRLNVPLLVAGMQKTVASLAACGMPSVRSPAGMPVSVMVLLDPWPTAPGFVLLGPDLPAALDTRRSP